jgi:hypothetical protein
MALSETTLQALHKLVENDPALLAQLQQTDDAAQSARILTEAARAAHIDVEETALCTHLEQLSAKAGSVALSDAQLDLVAGGGEWTRAAFVMMSVGTLGIGCAAVSRSVYDAGKPLKNNWAVGTVDYCVG